MRILFLCFITILSTYRTFALDEAKDSAEKSDSSLLLESERKTINVYRETVPSVVNVSNIRIVRDVFFGIPEQREAGAGTGFVWDDRGHIVTNFHVVQDRESTFMISFYGQKEAIKAKVVGVAPKLDIAVLKVDKLPDNAKPIKLGSSQSLQVGQIALAIGNPFELDYTMTSGIISALGRNIDGIGGVKIHNMIQTDADINPGNSGGPLLDSHGQLIGMNTMIFSPTRASNGLGFAVPVDSIKRAVPDLIKHGKIIRPGLGISILPEYYQRNLVQSKGVIIAYVEKDGPADKAKIKGMRRDPRGRVYIGDILLSIEGKEVNSLDDIYQILSEFKIGDTIKAKIKRDNDKTKEVKIKLQAL
ncbi:MAG: trypsin-like peptidase domain-containing protein [Halobacteriovoraceae bacterium]|nr:trypsin-like peptidase domain-containing protein [Halobacteriovoraceae bacterium]